MQLLEILFRKYHVIDSQHNGAFCLCRTDMAEMLRIGVGAIPSKFELHEHESQVSSSRAQLAG